MIDEAESQKVPEGFVLVPIETIEKVRVGLRDWELPDNRYAALDAINSDFAAAPKPEKAEPLQGLSETSEELGGYTPDFCDANCTWRDHHPECERADHSEQHLEMVEPAAQEPISYTPGRWFQARSIDEMQAFYLSRLDAIRQAAKDHGYAIGLHGSMRRDFDLMAMPWRDDCSAPDELAIAIQDAACGISASCVRWEKKPNGRIATSMCICWTDHANPEFEGMISAGHIDLSVIAPQDRYAANELDLIAANEHAAAVEQHLIEAQKRIAELEQQRAGLVEASKNLQDYILKISSGIDVPDEIYIPWINALASVKCQLEIPAKTHTEQIEWFRPADQLPDDDTTVLFIEAGEVDVFMGYLDADQWRAEPHGEPIGEVAWWAHLPEGPAQ